jgi:membrane protease YdiL (CAAX protease family)
VNGVLNRLNIARAAPPSESVAWVYRNVLVALGVLWVSLRLLEGKRFRDAGLAARRAPGGLTGGFLLGAVLFSAVVGTLALLGSYRIQGLFPLPPGSGRLERFGLATLLLFLAAMAEEVKLRAILFRLLEQSLGTWVAIGLSAAAFGFGHWHNPGATIWSSLAIAFEGGVLLAALYAATRSLWVPLGMHWGWNLLEGPVWGTGVSGNQVGVLFQGAVSGPSWLTGGAFGPEAGVPALIVGGIAGILAVVWMVRRGQVIAGPWARSPAQVPASDPGALPERGAPVPEAGSPPIA